MGGVISVSDLLMHDRRSQFLPLLITPIRQLMTAGSLPALMTADF
jgi:hypothetical protein